MQGLKLLVMCILAAILFGLLHDQVTVRVCMEYFSIGHPPPPFPTESPTWLALQWGVIATWWFGLILGIPFALASRVGTLPKLTVKDQCKPLVILFAATAIGSLTMGVVGYFLANSGVVWLVERLAQRIPADRHIYFLADLWAHNAAYLVAGLGAVVLWIVTLVRRLRLWMYNVKKKYELSTTETETAIS